MNNLLLTITLSIVAFSNIATLWHYIQLKRKIDIEAWAWTEDRSELRRDSALVSKRLETLNSGMAAYGTSIAKASYRLSEMNRQLCEMRGEGNWTLEDVAAVATKEAQMTRDRIAQVKTRLADEEREDQQAKARVRRSRRKEGK